MAVADFFAPPKTVIGSSDARTEAIVSAIYNRIDEKSLFISIEAAEMVKYADNVWHATKVAFGNEIGRLCKALGIDSHEVMNVFVKDLKLNLSPYYLKPGFAFGGSCLPKEVRAVGHLGRELGVSLPLVDSLSASNSSHIDKAVELLRPFAGKRIGFLGVTFKPNTDDLRESPTLELMARVQSNGSRLAAYDPNLASGPHLESQIAYVRHASPGQARLMDELKDLMTPTQRHWSPAATSSLSRTPPTSSAVPLPSATAPSTSSTWHASSRICRRTARTKASPGSRRRHHRKLNAIGEPGRIHFDRIDKI